MNWRMERQADDLRVWIQRTPDQDLLPELVKLELSLGSSPIHSMTLAFDPGVEIPRERLERLDYRPSAPREYIKSLPHRRSVRFSITEKCNYRCFFCHEEGLDMDRERQKTEEAALFKVFDQLKALDYDDLTFTGGEPLLKWRQILRALEYMQAIGYRPDVKFVSNGRVLNDTFIEGLKRYPGRVRFNISMHSLDSACYDRIVHPLSSHTPGTRDDLAHVQHNLARLNAAEIPFKLNFVLLNGLNTSAEQIDRIFAYALACGARRVKFLELLITRTLKDLYPYYYRLQALRDQLGDQLTPLESGLRRTVYRYRDTPLLVELQSCTCSRGCNVCSLNRDVNFTAEQRYFPCFLHPEDGVDLRVSSLSEAIDSGAAYIADMAHRFGDHSPIIIRDHYLTRQETAYYYAIARDDIPRFVAHIEHAYGLELQRHRRLRETYFSDGSDAFERFEYVRKLAINTYDHQATEITQQHRVDPAGSGCIETAFGEDSPAIADIADYQRELAQQGFHRVLQVAWELDYYGSGGQPTGDLSLSLGQVLGGEMALVRSCRPLQDAPCPLRPLTQPVPAWLMTHHKLVVPTEPAD
ncbi:radical SAM protein [Allochromatium vinosum]|uniref:Radical SAM domain protein n=1 Tax=Allochromatium vinosum (strain ATCC 17899 / DSM 180 / NBRC 103801 / NCIMB 10441 / D) TaxID=572477 RepID=D3RW21_ALLVD|nr:radical SAM protein [Allochromatium vinosum]ADC64033.1 Radical SAM domain protein [Allochromatium vinosum DSM 180]